MSTMRDAIERGVTRAITHWRDGDIKTREVSTVAADLVMKESLLSDYVLSVLDDEFHARLQEALQNLSARIADAARERPVRVLPIQALPDRIAEWAEDIDRINCAIFEYTQAEDVLKALEFITMPGCDWSTYREDMNGN